ncbi:MAG: hypothetical protein M1827_002812 [Pycnora praestabilis]|nr:MAG: hypothetical protein M1827_002812 [Pycnora praestabilis]
MSRNKSFLPRHEPLRHVDTLQLNDHKITGPVTFLNPTRAHFDGVTNHCSRRYEKQGTSEGSAFPNDAVSKNERLADYSEFKWTSRNNRKGRHALVVDPAQDAEHAKYIVPKSTHTLREAMRGIWRMCVKYPIWDVSYLVAIIFTWGSVVWVINAFFVWLPLQIPSSEFKDEISSGGGISAFIGATIFELGSVLLMFEAFNENRSGCFGWALEQAFEGDAEKGGLMRLRPDIDGCVHHHTNKKNLVGKGRVPSNYPKASSDSNSSAEAALPPNPKVNAEEGRAWVWFPSWYELKTHYFHEIGFIASFSQFCGATVFWMSGFTALPGIYDTSNVALGQGIYWSPQVVGGCGFIISGFLYMVETQPKWYIPAPKVLGWHIAAWNFIGGIGFTFWEYLRRLSRCLGDGNFEVIALKKVKDYVRYTHYRMKKSREIKIEDEERTWDVHSRTWMKPGETAKDQSAVVGVSHGGVQMVPASDGSSSSSGSDDNGAMVIQPRVKVPVQKLTVSERKMESLLGSRFKPKNGALATESQGQDINASTSRTISPEAETLHTPARQPSNMHPLARLQAETAETQGLMNLSPIPGLMKNTKDGNDLESNGKLRIATEVSTSQKLKRRCKRMVYSTYGSGKAGRSDNVSAD